MNIIKKISITLISLFVILLGVFSFGVVKISHTQPYETDLFQLDCRIKDDGSFNVRSYLSFRSLKDDNKEIYFPIYIDNKKINQEELKFTIYASECGSFNIENGYQNSNYYFASTLLDNQHLDINQRNLQKIDNKDVFYLHSKKSLDTRFTIVFEYTILNAVDIYQDYASFSYDFSTNYFKFQQLIINIYKPSLSEENNNESMRFNPQSSSYVDTNEDTLTRVVCHQEKQNFKTYYSSLFSSSRFLNTGSNYHQSNCFAPSFYTGFSLFNYFIYSYSMIVLLVLLLEVVTIVTYLLVRKSKQKKKLEKTSSSSLESFYPLILRNLKSANIDVKSKDFLFYLIYEAKVLKPREENQTVVFSYIDNKDFELNDLFDKFNKNLITYSNIKAIVKTNKRRIRQHLYLQGQKENYIKEETKLINTPNIIYVVLFVLNLVSLLLNLSLFSLIFTTLVNLFLLVILLCTNLSSLITTKGQEVLFLSKKGKDLFTTNSNIQLDNTHLEYYLYPSYLYSYKNQLKEYINKNPQIIKRSEYIKSPRILFTLLDSK